MDSGRENRKYGMIRERENGGWGCTINAITAVLFAVQSLALNILSTRAFVGD